MEECSTSLGISTRTSGRDSLSSTYSSKTRAKYRPSERLLESSYDAKSTERQAKVAVGRGPPFVTAGLEPLARMTAYLTDEILQTISLTQRSQPL